VAEVRRKFFTKIPPQRVMPRSQHRPTLHSRQGQPNHITPPQSPYEYHLNEHRESRCERCYTVDAAKILLNCLTTCLRSIAGLAVMNSVLGSLPVGGRDFASQRRAGCKICRGCTATAASRRNGVIARYPRFGRNPPHGLRSDCLHYCCAFCELGRSPSSVHRWLTGSLLSTTRSYRTAVHR
jgi:hypothetical protein